MATGEAFVASEQRKALQWIMNPSGWKREGDTFVKRGLLDTGLFYGGLMLPDGIISGGMRGDTLRITKDTPETGELLARLRRA